MNMLLMLSESLSALSSVLFNPTSLDALLYMLLMTLAFSSILLVRQHLYAYRWTYPHFESIESHMVWVLSALFVALSYDAWVLGMLYCIIGISLMHIAQRAWPDFFILAYNFLISSVMLSVLILLWGWHFIATNDFPYWLSTLLSVNIFIALILYSLGHFSLLPYNSYLFRKTWHRPRHLLPKDTQREDFPMVSIHVPCYSEPPEVVLKTLESLTQLDYPNYEVIVIDNNTTDERLWRPLEARCKVYGERFKFYHVENLSGAKAGALNHISQFIAPEAEIIAVVDADYIVDADFLIRLVPYFDNPKLGFVQTPHDYRFDAKSTFQRSCYWEYIPAYRLKIACLNEWVASYIVGTMCLIRKEAVIGSGGWSEDCLTEDAEMALRIHAREYESIYVAETMGRGLIPESFSDYKKQRYRWTFGPIQQLKAHWRLLMPNQLFKRQTNGLSFNQKWLELFHSIRELSSLFTTLLFFQSLFLAILFINTSITFPLPSHILSFIGVNLFSVFIMRYLTYHLSGCWFLRDLIMAEVAALSLSHIKLLASFKALFNVGEVKWERTNKFKRHVNIFRAIKSVSLETLVGMLFFSLALHFYAHASSEGIDFIWLAAIECLVLSLTYWSSTIMAVLSEYDLFQRSQEDSPLYFENVTEQ